MQQFDRRQGRPRMNDVTRMHVPKSFDISPEYRIDPIHRLIQSTLRRHQGIAQLLGGDIPIFMSVLDTMRS